MRHAGGFSIVELLVATAATLVVIGAALALIGQSHSVFAAQPEAADEEQRLRVGVDMLFTDLVAAGAGPDGGRLAGPLVRSFAPVLPFKRGTRADDPAGSYFPDRVTIVSVAPGAARTHLADPSSLPSDWIAVEPQASCPPTSPLCQFVAGSSLAIADGLGEADVVALTAVTASPPMLQHANQPLAFSAYQPTAADLVAVSNVVYVWNAATNQLEVTSSVGGITAPAVDNVVALSFAYYGDPAPPQLTGVAPDDPIGPWTTYGPKPPPLEVQANAAWPPGENCVFAVADGNQVPRLPALAGGVALVPLGQEQLTDGPWCPDPYSANRWDADLLRIRMVVVTLRIQAAIAALRGPAGALFAAAGTGRDPTRWVPDRQVTFKVSPRNLNLAGSP
ncbi:MAG TPA: hypothetical protein VFB07_02005 [Vicinamibacterales bacterium]|nr:hypothetical protein [Vicinamibacterales bacterium]